MKRWNQEPWNVGTLVAVVVITLGSLVYVVVRFVPVISALREGMGA